MASSTPQPMEGLHDTSPPPFLTKTFDIVEDASTNHIVSWSSGNNSFVVWDPQTFAISLLPKYFKHNNFSSFVRQLNTYGFRKVDPDKWEFANEGFLRGQRHLLRNIRRRKTTQSQASQQALDHCVEVGLFGLDGEIGQLRRDKHVLMMELVKLRQQQQNTKSCLQVMDQRLKKTEVKQQQMMTFLARAMQNPNFLQHLVQQKDKRRELEEAITKKRRRSIDQGPSSVEVEELSQNGHESFLVKIEPEDFDDTCEIDNITLNMQGLSEGQNYLENIEEEHGTEGKEIEEEFWEDFLKNNLEEEMGSLGFGGEEEEDVDVLVEQLGYLDSSPK